MTASIRGIDPDEPAPRAKRGQGQTVAAIKDRARNGKRPVVPREPSWVAVPPHLVRGLVAAYDYVRGEVLFLAPAPGKCEC